MLPRELQPEVISALYTKLTTPGTELEQFFPRVPNASQGNLIKYDVKSFRNGMARITDRFGKPQRRETATLAHVIYEALTLKDAIDVPPEIYKDARAAGSLSDSAREQVVADAVYQLKLYHNMRLEWARAQWLTGGALLTSAGLNPGVANGTAYLDYQTLPNNSPFPVALGFSATHIAATVGASWETAATDIKSDLDTARSLIAADSGVDARLVLMCWATYNSTIMANTAAKQAEISKAEIARYGMIKELWGYEFMVYDAKYPVDLDTMAETTAETDYFIPDHVVILMSRDNAASGRALFECEPSDANVPPGARGVYVWQDDDPTHPHMPTQGIEWTGGPSIAIPDSQFIWTDITAT